MKRYSVVWTHGVAANSALEAVMRAHYDQVATIYHVREDVDSCSLADSELEDRGYQTIDIEDAASNGARNARLQDLLCAPWNVRPAIAHENEIVVLAQNTLIIVDPNGIAVVHIEGYGIEGAI